MTEIDFDAAFTALTGHPPFPWQQALYARFSAGDFPESCNLPTGLGKTSVVAVWLIALAAGKPVPRRLVYVVNRRTVVDQTTDEVEKYRANLEAAGLFAPLRELCAIELKDEESPLALSTLRGQFQDNRAWAADPARPAVVVGTVDMIGSRLLFGGYGVGFKARPLHAGFLGQDALLIHDEAHLEPAFQRLIEAIECEQNGGRLDDRGRCIERKSCPSDFRPLRVMELSATSRGRGETFGLTEKEKGVPSQLPKEPSEPLHYVWRRLKSKKGARFHPAKRDEVAKVIGKMARDRWKASGQAVIIFVRTLDDVKAVADVLTDKKNGGVGEAQVQRLTGTLRGLERDELATADPVFARFLPQPKVTPAEGTVYLICTSAGEVGVDISADHMVCDLTTLDSMAQRFGRVNRRGEGAAEIDVVYETDPNPKPPSPGFEAARWKAKAELERLPGCDWIPDRFDASPDALGALMESLTGEAREAAFAPTPTFLPVSDILFDAWALTTVRDRLPGRPMVEPYLHGISDYDPPQTAVAWREEVGLLTQEVLDRNKLTPEDALELYPLKPHELLTGPTHGKNKVFEQLEGIAARDAKREAAERLSAWVVAPDGGVTVYSLEKLVEKDKQNKPAVVLGGRTVLLPPKAGGLKAGLLDGESPAADDVADDWFEDKERTRRRRLRLRAGDPRLETAREEMRLVRRIDLPADSEDDPDRPWYWYTRPASADDDGEKAAREPITWDHHTGDVTRNATRIADALLKPHPDLHRALVRAAELHDLGKRREVWQRSIGNPRPTDWHAKSGKPKDRPAWRPIELTDYRHEFGSLLDLEADESFRALRGEPEVQEVIRHLVAAHHGYGRPHFPAGRAFDPKRGEGEATATAREVPRRFARLQRKYGRWGLAYLESLLRAADYAASAAPSALPKGGES